MAFAVATRRCITWKLKNLVVTPMASYSTKGLRPIEETKLPNVKRGTGYRSSYSGIVCTVFGATGFVGQNFCSRLANHGVQIIVPYRGDTYHTHWMKSYGDLGQVLFSFYNLEDEESIKRAMKYSDIVVNLVGRDYDTWNYSLEKVHIEGARRIAKCARETGIKKLIHMSAMGASPTPREIQVPGGSRFMKSKWYGEQVVREEFPEAVIVRPSEIYGDMDRFFGYYGPSQRLIWRKLYLWKEGLDTVKQPVYVVDVCSGLHELVVRHKDDVAGKTYQFVGPRRYILRDLLEYIYGWMWKDDEWDFEIMDSRFSVSHLIYSLYRDKAFYANPTIQMSKERFEREHTTDTLDPNALMLQDLGVDPQNIEDLVRQMVWNYRAYPIYSDEIFEFIPPDPPRTVQDM